MLREEISAAMAGIVVLLTEADSSFAIEHQWRGYTYKQRGTYTFEDIPHIDDTIIEPPALN